jgi:hypothetical protein
VGGEVVSKKGDNKTAWFAVRVGVLCLLLNYVLGGMLTLMFVAGWWWGVKDVPSEDEASSDLT